jgi:hypothetical protein
VLEVEQVPHVLGHLCPTGTETWALEVAHGLEALLPLGILLVVDRNKRGRHVDGGGEAVLTQRSEDHVCHLLDGVVNLSTGDDSRSRHHGVEGYLHPNLTHIQAMGLKGAAMIEGDRLIVVEAEECIPTRSWKPRTVLARGTKTSIIAKGTVGVIIHVHLRNCHENITNRKVINSEQ